jgi:hypothetical protein
MGTTAVCSTTGSADRADFARYAPLSIIWIVRHATARDKSRLTISRTCLVISTATLPISTISCPDFHIPLSHQDDPPSCPTHFASRISPFHDHSRQLLVNWECALEAALCHESEGSRRPPGVRPTPCRLQIGVKLWQVVQGMISSI